MRKIWIVAVALALAACGQAQNQMVTTEPVAATEEYAAADLAEQSRGAAPPAQAPQAASGPAQNPSAPPGPAPILYLAYSYAVGLELPAARVAGVMDAHTQACVAAGPRQCQLISANRDGDPQTSVSGALSLRAEPRWLAAFRGRLAGEAESAGGRVRSQSTNTEDLTRAIVDTEASLRALRTLRDRLQQMLASRPGRLADLLEVERELARVQTQIESTESNLAVMRTRVAMSELTVNYQSTPRAVAADTFEPLTDAGAGFLGFIAASLALMLTALGFLLPWALLAGLLAWIVLRIVRRSERRRREAPPPAA